MSSNGLRSTPGCVCGEINTRHCPVHGQGATPREPGDSLSLSRGKQDDLLSLFSCPRGHPHAEGAAFCTVCGAGPVLENRPSLFSFRRPRSYTPEFERHAALEAIKAHIEKARERQAEIQNELGWLEGLCLRRSMPKCPNPYCQDGLVALSNNESKAAPPIDCRHPSCPSRAA